ncbi:MAG: hypothetical protein K2H13_10375 [Eubacterium sp.]|nr:hypothetical protein [Eubacterium sp.]
MNNNVVLKLSKFAMIMAIIGVCTLGVWPAFAIMGMVVGLVFRSKGVVLNEECQKKIKTTYILGAISLVMFVIDIVIACVFFI